MSDKKSKLPKVEGKLPARTDIRTIAKAANVSIATVSRAMNRAPTVNPKMAKRVWEVIDELDYVPNTHARALVSGRSRLFGLIVSEITNPFFPELIQGFEGIAVEHGYEILIGSTNYDPKRMSHCIRRMLERKVDGVAVMTFGIEEPLLDQLANRKVPLVFIDIDQTAGDQRPKDRLSSRHTTGCTTPSGIGAPKHLLRQRTREIAFRAVPCSCLSSSIKGMWHNS